MSDSIAAASSASSAWRRAVSAGWLIERASAASRMFPSPHKQQEHHHNEEDRADRFDDRDRGTYRSRISDPPRLSAFEQRSFTDDI